MSPDTGQNRKRKARGTSDLRQDLTLPEFLGSSGLGGTGNR